jgi:glycosyltransferase involved in cell wall biosynthesis
MLLHKTVQHDSRVRREADSLARAGHDVTVVHLPKGAPVALPASTQWAVRSADPPGWVARLTPFNAYRVGFLLGFVAAIRRLRPDVVHAHDAAMLLPAILGARLTGASVVYDSHELATGVPYRERAWAWFVRTLESLLVPRCKAVITVSEGIAERIQQLYGLRAAPVVVRNVSDLPLADGRRDLRSRVGLSQDVPLILHQGAAAEARGCEGLIVALAQLDEDFHVVFLGDNDPGMTEKLTSLAREQGVADRVSMLGAVPLDDLLSLTADADVGVALLEDTCENHRLALPNKLFEYIRARVPVVASDLPEMGRVIREREIGSSVDPADPQALAQAIRLVLERSRSGAFGTALEDAARELSWDVEQNRLLELYERLDRGACGQSS